MRRSFSPYQSFMTGDIVLLPEGAYHIVSNYGDANATVRSDIRVNPSCPTWARGRAGRKNENEGAVVARAH